MDTQTLPTRPFTTTFPSFTSTWSRINGITVDDGTIAIEPDKFFFRYENPTWNLCNWAGVKETLLDTPETVDTAIEQTVLDYVTEHSFTTDDPSQVLKTAWEVYSYLFRDNLADEPELANTPENALTMLRECGTLMALNRVELTGHISNVSPAWMLCIAMEKVYDLDNDTAMAMDELYHSGWFNEYRRRESLLAHAALGGRLVHGCQGAANQSGGVVVPFGADMDQFRSELSQMRIPWIEATRS